ncbi:hypothetical protein LU683_29920 [Pseudomonas asiatica]|uniref:hypothetical protein n=1 Tax=Pseudomonas asiatica TaxID=2219225 RepID=UPI001E46ED3B|nr:hypothetical protein [Pseudomonas asiatica]MCE0757102.1 hypothetical protein [Pseudomonas asiatica]MCE1032738.1 hypothetical protein [Pseudomonas asiatica]MCE1067437.1 hypothetical protein [Pseudomonas asiatica]MCE1102086.1 hypothetical protein [Pseudomonas asiatica]MCE1107641.1 hypothetical protein [Pseudomonas asiatica]
MQLAILLVLILIAILIAPWLIGVIVALAALYGVWVVVGAITVGAVVIVGTTLVLVLEKLRKKSSSRTIDLQIAEANRAYRERMESSPVEAPALEKKVSKAVRTKPCPSCEGNVPVGSLYCPSCGKLVPAKKM